MPAAVRPPAAAPAADRHIGLSAATAVLISNMVGTGVFTSLGFQVVALSDGFALLMLWVFGGLLALSGALCYAELGTLHPRSGGEYVYLTEAWAPAWGFIGGFVSMTAGFAAPIALAAMAFGRYAAAVAPVTPLLATAVAVAAIGGVHFAGVAQARRFQVLSTYTVVALILAFVAVGLAVGPVEPMAFSPSAASWAEMRSAPFAVSLIYVVYAYTGWNAIGYIAGEVATPQRSIPRAVVLAVCGVAALYLALHWVFLRSVPLDALRGTVEVGALAGTRILGEAGGRVMSGVIALVLVATISAFLLAGSRVTQAVGTGSARLAWMAARGADGVPRRALALQLTLVALLIVTSSFEQVLAYTGVVLNLMNLMAVAGLLRLRRRAHADQPRFRMPWFPLPPLVFAALSLWMIGFVVWERPAVLLSALGTLAAGGLLFRWVSAPPAR